MARSVTVIVTLASGSDSAGVQFLTDGRKWEKSEPGGADDVFKTKRGVYRVVGSSTELMRSGGGARVGRFASFDPETIRDGATGQGLSDDVGDAVTWKVDGIFEI